jgi:hypothetical protein
MNKGSPPGSLPFGLYHMDPLFSLRGILIATCAVEQVFWAGSRLSKGAD